MDIGKQKRLYQTFCSYIDACKKQNQILWDSVASPELLEPHKKQSYFINAFESMGEFKDLIKALEDWDDRKPKEEVEESHGYRLRLRSCLQHFFTNTGIYDRIISGREFNKERAFSRFLEELEKKEIEILKYGEVFPLKIEMKKGEVLDSGNFSLQIELGKYEIDYATTFAILLHHSLCPHHLGMPYSRTSGVGAIEKLGEDEYVLDGETPFSLLLFIFNLYFDKPLCIPEWYEEYRSLLSPWYQPERTYLEHTRSIRVKYDDALQEYMEKKYDAMWYEVVGESEEPNWEKWDQWDKLKAEEEEKFINSGKAPINYLREAETERFKEFIIKIREFLRSDSYKKQEYLKVATHYFLMAHERPDIADNLVNYVIALESLYFEEETSEMKERLANRIANLLGETPEEKTKIREIMLDIYRLRCKYVHGKHTDADVSGKFQQVVFRRENWLRNVLRFSLLVFFGLSKYYNTKKMRNELLETLDSVFDFQKVNNIKMQSLDFLSLARPYDFLSYEDKGDDIEKYDDAEEI